MLEELKNDFKCFLEGVRQNKLTLIACIATIIFLAIFQDVVKRELLRLDGVAYWFAVETLRNEFLTPIMQGFSNLASPVVIFGMLIIIAAFVPGKKPGRCAFLNLVLVVIINQALKFIIQRPRPIGYRLVSEVGYSFPSGHSMVAMAFYGFLAWVAWHYEPTKLERYGYTFLFGLLVCMVGFSRIYLGVHYASDVVAGFCISLVWLSFYTKTIAPIFLPNLSAGNIQEPKW